MDIYEFIQDNYHELIDHISEQSPYAIFDMEFEAIRLEIKYNDELTQWAVSEGVEI